MTYQETIWQGRYVWVVSIMSKSGKMHRYVRKYVGRGGIVLGEAKNNMLLIQFKNHHGMVHTRCIPAGCVVDHNVPKSGLPYKDS